MRKGIGHEIGKRRVPDHTKTAPRGVKTPQDAPRPRSWSQLGPKRGPKIDPKSIKIRAWEPPRPKTPQDPPQGKENDTKIEEKTINFDAEDMQKKASIPLCFSMVLGREIGACYFTVKQELWSKLLLTKFC